MKDESRDGMNAEAASRDVSETGDAAEREADAVAASVRREGLGGPAVRVSAAPTARLHLDRAETSERENLDDEDENHPDYKPHPTMTSFYGRKPLPIETRHKQLTDEDVYGPVDRRAARLKQQDARRQRRYARRRARYIRITRVSRSKRFNLVGTASRRTTVRRAVSMRFTRKA